MNNKGLGIIEILIIIAVAVIVAGMIARTFRNDGGGVFPGLPGL